MKKGYKAEWEAKKILFKKYLKDSVFKVAIGGAVDFFILGKNGKVKKIIEIKKTNKNWWYPSEHDEKQYQQLKKIQKKFKIPIEYWIKINGEWKIFDLKEIKKFFC
jgi:hypothetical protein